MHVVFGILGLAATLAATIALGHTQVRFTGVFYGPALLLLLAAPPFIALTSHGVEQLLGTLQSVWQAVRFSVRRSRAQLYDELTRFAAEERRGRAAEALGIAERAQHPLLRQLGPLVLKRYAPEEIERTASTASFCLASSMKRSEDVLASLARVAPAMGLVGTTLGLITLLRELQNFEQLGPSMALALLCTLYGLVLANAVYQPLSRLVHDHAVVLQEEGRLLTRALLLVAADKPLADVRALFDAPAAETAPDARLALG
jgi:chemotaxis protein MotA